MKEYIRPAIVCAELECMQMIAASLGTSDEEAQEDASSNKFDMNDPSLWDDINE